MSATSMKFKKASKACSETDIKWNSLIRDFNFKAATDETLLSEIDTTEDMINLSNRDNWEFDDKKDWRSHKSECNRFISSYQNT